MAHSTGVNEETRTLKISKRMKSISDKYELVFGSFCSVKKALIKQTKGMQNEENLIYTERHKILSEQHKKDGNGRKKQLQRGKAHIQEGC